MFGTITSWYYVEIVHPATIDLRPGHNEYIVGSGS
jgi:hypothetical protein